MDILNSLAPGRPHAPIDPRSSPEEWPEDPPGSPRNAFLRGSFVPEESIPPVTGQHLRLSGGDPAPETQLTIPQHSSTYHRFSEVGGSASNKVCGPAKLVAGHSVSKRGECPEKL